MNKLNILFVCTANVDRSPTAEAVVREMTDPGDVEISSAGVAPYATTPVNEESIRWAHVIIGMERGHLSVLRDRFGTLLAGKTLTCFYISDVYSYMNDSLVRHVKCQWKSWEPTYQRLVKKIKAQTKTEEDEKDCPAAG